MSSKVQESTDFVALDACHEQTKSHLIDLLAMLQQMMNSGIDGEVQAKAAKIEEFFSGASRKHHLDEERNVFPPLLDSGDAELIAAVRTMQQDHGWIEENWLELGPQLRAIAAGNHWFDMEEFQQYVEVFNELCSSHIAVEEALIYPHAKASLARLNRSPPAG
jgi:hemerythrin-like domain-containing protein